MIFASLFLRLRCVHDWLEYERTTTGFWTTILFSCTRCPAMKTVQMAGVTRRATDPLERIVK